MDDGYIKLFRKMMEWEWYKDSCTKDLFIHCLMKANYIDKRWKGIEVPRGSFISSLNNLSEELGFSVRQIRTALKHLKATSEVTSKSYSKYTLFTVLNYDEYQQGDKQSDKQVTSKRQASDKQVTTTNKERTIRRKENNNNYIYSSKKSSLSELPDWFYNQDEIEPTEEVNDEELEALRNKLKG